MKIHEHVPLAGLTSFRVGGPARWLVEARSEDELTEALAWAEAKGVAPFFLGGGSNLLVADSGFDGLVVRLTLQGVTVSGALVEAAAGENWDDLVSTTVRRGLAGMECLAGIPGSTGATPVQNVGAYGQEVADTIDSVRVFDRSQRSFADLPRAACQFRYRTSLFNTEEAGRFVVTRVRFLLRPGGRPELRYADLQRHFAGQGSEPSLPEVAQAVRTIRRSKGMVLVEGDPDTQSAGSYFKNPIIASAFRARVAEAAQVEAEAVPAYAADQGFLKLSAAWLVERAGFPKGYRMGAAGLSSRHTLALSNRGGATCSEILALERRIVEGVEERFGVRLHREPVLLGDSSLPAA